MPSSEIGLSLDSTRSPPVTPLPAPTTVSSRSLRPRRSRGRSSARSSAVSSSRSRSHSVAGASQPLYHEDADNPERRAEPQDFTLRHIATISEGSSVDTDASITHVGAVSSPSVKGPGGSSMQAKRRRSVSPVADGSGSGGRRGKRRVLQDTVWYQVYRLTARSNKPKSRLRHVYRRKLRPWWAA
ncbi:hypothetical protein BD309DRAFT_267253 [Dichomitus squalens]|nr:hypothetical protein BD309DRAFT_267253 [Dichomitus squalens]